MLLTEARESSKMKRMSDKEFAKAIGVAQKILTASRKEGYANWSNATAVSHLNASTILRALKRQELGLPLRPNSTGGRQRLLSDYVIKRLVETQRMKAMGDGYTFEGFIDDVQKYHKNEQMDLQPGAAVKPLVMDVSTWRKYYVDLFPESSYTDSTQNMARILAALNGCTSIAHAVNIYANIIVSKQEGSLIFNMDRSTLYLNKSQAYQLRFLSGQKGKARRFKQGPSKSSNKDEDSKQKRTIHVDELTCPGLPDFIRTCIHMTDNGIPSGLPPPFFFISPSSSSSP